MSIRLNSCSVVFGLLSLWWAVSWPIARFAAAQELAQAADLAKSKYTSDQQQRLSEATKLNSQVEQLFSQGKYAEAVKFAQQALSIRKEVLGENDPDYAISLNNLAALYRSMGDYAKSEPLYKQALAIRKEVLGEKDPAYASSLNNLGSLYDSMGDYDKAEPLYQQALAIRKQVLGGKHPDYATSLNNLALLYKNMGDFTKAEPLYQQALAIRTAALGIKHPHYAQSLNNLADLYHAMRDYAKAEPLYQQALAIRKEILGEKHPDYAASLNNLALLYSNMGDYAEAEPLYREALAIHKEAFGEKHPAYATSLNNLAELYRSTGDYAKAEPLYRQALAIRKEVFGEHHPAYANSLNNLALLYHNMGDYAEAEPLYRQTSEILNEVLGDKHPNYALSLNNLAMLYYSMADFVQAEPLALQALQISQQQLDVTAVIQSERQQLRMADTVGFYLGNYLSVAQGASISAEQVYPEVLAWKGAVSARQQAMRQLHGAQQDPQVARLYHQLTDTARQLDNLSRIVPKPDQAKQYRQQLQQLSETLETLQQKLALASADFRRELEQKKCTPADLQRVLPADAVLVDLLEYLHYEPPRVNGKKPTWERRIAAFVVRPQQPVVWIELGPSRPIAALVDRWRKSYSAADGAELRRLVWQPLEAKIAGAKTVLVSPDGPLDRFPLAALPGQKEGTYLIEDVAIATVPIPRLLPAVLQPSDSARAPPSLLLVGGVDFGADPGRIDQMAMDRSAARGKGPLSWPPLPGTAAEVAAIKQSYAQLKAQAPPIELTGAAATKSAVRSQLGNCRYVHLSTHGFFAPPQVRSALDHSGDAQGRSGLELLTNQDVTGYHPDLLSGVVLAGANRPQEDGQEDGILTALEVGQLDLSHVELATLSACETGLGTAAGGEGVLGLQRAFQLAGAKTVVAGLWKVPDKATQLLMSRFYDNLWQQRMSKLEALRQAQLWLLTESSKQASLVRGLELEPSAQSADKEGHLPPFYWAAFELSGDWR